MRKHWVAAPRAGFGLLLAAMALSAPTLAADRSAAPAAAPARGLPDNQLAPLSLTLQHIGEAQLARGQTQAATDSFESALAADPRNRQAYLGLARAAEAEGLPGKAVRFYREALEIEPNDLATLELQGIALVERGAKARAEANLERIRKLCTANCPPADRLAAAIARGAKTAKPEATALAQPAN
jgi:Tfp pilus assembly protein PilF